MQRSPTPDLLTLLKRLLYHHNPTKFIGHVAAHQRRQDRSNGNYPSVSKNIAKVETALSKEGRSKHAVTLPCWLECFFLDLCLNPQGLTWKEGKKRSSHILWVLLRDNFLKLYQHIHLHYRRNRNAPCFSHGKAPSSDSQSSNLFPK